MSSKVRNIYLVLTCTLSLVASGCVETSTMYHGNSISPAVNVVALQKGGPHAHTWETFDLLIDYKYIQDNDVIEISGQAVLGEHYQMNYTSLSKLFVYLFFLDENLRVLKTANLVKAMTGGMDEILTFSQRYNVPAGATSLSFGYDGTARERDQMKTFYKLPLTRK